MVVLRLFGIAVACEILFFVVGHHIRTKFLLKTKDKKNMNTKFSCDISLKIDKEKL